MKCFYKRIPNPVFRKYSIESTKKSIQKLIDDKKNNTNLKIITKSSQLSSIPFIIIFSSFLSQFIIKYLK